MCMHWAGVTQDGLSCWRGHWEGGNVGWHLWGYWPGGIGKWLVEYEVMWIV
jgi:hypothetical protein